MAVSIRPLHDVFVGEVSGVDITKPLTRDEVAAIEAGMDRYAVLVFHDQKLTDEQQMAFSQNFGAASADTCVLASVSFGMPIWSRDSTNCCLL